MFDLTHDPSKSPIPEDGAADHQESHTPTSQEPDRMYLLIHEDRNWRTDKFIFL